jgi:hypothetical protein
MEQSWSKDGGSAEIPTLMPEGTNGLANRAGPRPVDAPDRKFVPDLMDWFGHPNFDSGGKTGTGHDDAERRQKQRRGWAQRAPQCVR